MARGGLEKIIGGWGSYHMDSVSFVFRGELAALSHGDADEDGIAWVQGKAWWS